MFFLDQITAFDIALIFFSLNANIRLNMKFNI